MLFPLDPGILPDYYSITKHQHPGYTAYVSEDNEHMK